MAEAVQVLLISEQTIPNVLSVLQHRPERLYLLHTKDHRLRVGMTNMVAYLRQRLPELICGEEQWLEVSPWDPQDSYRACRRLADQYGKALVLNVTGGTKLMAFGALQGGLEAEVPMVYVDTANQRFLPVGGQPLPAFFEGSLPKLQVEDYLKIFGVLKFSDKSKKADKEQGVMAPLADFYLHKTKQWLIHTNYLEAARNLWNRETGVVRLPLELRSKTGVSRCEPLVLQELARLKLIDNLRLTKSEVEFRVRNDVGWNPLRDTGRLLELLVYYRLKKADGLDDVRLNVEFIWSRESQQINQNNAPPNELDVVVSARSRLFCISCKSGKLEKEYLSELEAISNRLGGPFAKKILVASSFNPNDGVPRRAKEMGIRLISLQDLRDQPDILEKCILQ